ATSNNYALSISHPQGIIEPAGKRTYDIRYIENGFQVLYVIGSEEITNLYFPRYIDDELMKSFDPAIQKELRDFAYSQFDTELNAHFIQSYASELSRPVKRILYRIFYEDLGYELEDIQAMNFEHGITDTVDQVKLEIAV